MAHKPDQVPTFEEALDKCYGGSKHGRTDYVTLITMADAKAIVDGVSELKARIKLLEAVMELAEDYVFVGVPCKRKLDTAIKAAKVKE